MTPDRTPLRRCTALLAAGLLLGCASTSQRTAAERDGPAATADEAADRRSGCAGDCSLRVENRLDVDVQVSAERQPALPDLGVVRANRHEVFELPGFRGQQLEIWVRDEKTREVLHVTCIRQFPRGTGRLIVGSEIRGGGC